MIRQSAERLLRTGTLFSPRELKKKRLAMAESYSADRDVEGAFWAWFDGEGGWRLKSVDFFSTMSDGVRGVVARQARITRDSAFPHPRRRE